ncbi:hypothetical protein GGR26_002497 [Lewinella marina]|uniref:DinB-like domain-containing protein n=1 Tax=Neolewinella marina TaxID=438751 RepID=A0A2G0CC75_9BACT|nr:DinB family protein [Neolewinella marina]NJB86720.1 hypothetical protein [Neolewinella marina]PHK97527.1 hypothetical protein CGL56_15625 [Neolewinella marina]
MKPRSATALLNKLADRVRQNEHGARALAGLPETQLRLRPAPGSWNALEAVEHLNCTHAAYFPRVAEALDRTADYPTSPTFTSSWLGNLIASSMKPGPRSRAVPTFNRLNPLNETLDHGVIHRYLTSNRRLAAFIAEARSANLTRLHLRSPLLWVVRLRLGDCLRLLAYHDWRHLEQAGRAATTGVVHG